MKSPERRRKFLVNLLRKSMDDYTEGRADLGRLVRDILSLVDSLEELAEEA